MTPASGSSTDPHTLKQPEIAAIRAQLLEWYDRERRSLAWREQPSAYGTMVSEFMLQQTQVATVAPYYDSFMKRFPTLQTLARAPEEDVLAAWSGLGYYRRARSLKRAAETVLRLHGGKLPADREALLALPGFGSYTTAAVGSIALGMPLSAVDGNVRRVMARFFALTGKSLDREVAFRADALLDPDRPGDWNQAVMELGAMICTPRGPRCLLCPLHAACRARGAGNPEAYPAAKKLPAAKLVEEIAVALVRDGALLVLQRGEDGAFAGMWELPRLDTREVEAEELNPARVLFDVVRLRAASFDEVASSEATFTHHRIRTRLVRAGRLERGAMRRQRHVAHRWVKLDELVALAASKAQRRLFSLIVEAGIAREAKPGGKRGKKTSGAAQKTGRMKKSGGA